MDSERSRDEAKDGAPGAESGTHPRRRADVAAFLRALAVPSLAIDREGRVVAASPTLETLLGFASDALVGARVERLVDESADGVRRVLDCAIHPSEASALRDADLELVRADGQRVRARITSGSLSTDGGSVALLTVDVRTDPAEDRATRAALELERLRLRQLIATSPGTFCAFQMWPDGRATCPYASPSIETIYGASAEELAIDATVARERTHPDDRDKVGEAIARSATTLEPWHMEYRVSHPTRGTIWIEGHSMPTREPDGSTLWFGFLRDVTERRQAEDERRTASAKLRAALEAGGMGTWELDLGTMRLEWDEGMYALWGFDREDDVELDFEAVFSFIHPDDQPRMREATERVLASGGRSMVEYRVKLPKRGERWFQARNEVAVDEQGKPVRLFGIQMDVTDQKRAEEASLRTRTLEALGTLAGGIAHDFNNILLAILGHAGLAAVELPKDYPVQENLGEIQRAGRRAAELVRTILAFGRPEATRRETRDLRPVVSEALALLRASLPAMVAIRTRFAETLPLADVDAHQIHSVVVNLVTNAAHAIEGDSGTVTVELEPIEVTAERAQEVPGLHEGPYVCLRVTDDGRGMDATTLERAFDPFFTTKPVGKGTGLGLSVVHGVVNGHGGAIELESTPGRGTRFTLYFPATTSGAPHAETPRQGVVVGEGVRRRILFVDDEPVLVELGVRSLRKLGYEVVGCVDPIEALGRFRADPGAFDAVVTDLSMPGLSGLELGRAILRIRRDVPIVLTSGHVQPDHRDLAELLGIREVLEKPATAHRLGPVLAEILGKA
ncbi:MAG: PAS domain-containing protein [Polyangiales bacterium]